MPEKTATQVYREQNPDPVSFQSLVTARKAHEKLVQLLVDKMAHRSPTIIQPGGVYAIVDLTGDEKQLLGDSAERLAKLEFSYRHWQTKNLTFTAGVLYSPNE